MSHRIRGLHQGRKTHDFAALVSGGTYSSDFSHRAWGGTYWFWQKDNDSRHHYIHAASLKGIDASPEALTAFLKQHFEYLFPFGAQGQEGSTVRLGNLFTIAIRTPRPSAICCIRDSPYQFTFQTVAAKHVLKGEITFGVFRDTQGVLWLFQQGRGYHGENAFQRLLTRIAPPVLWPIMRRNLVALWQEGDT